MEKKKVFVIMPFQDQFFEVYEMLKMQFADSFEFTNAADEGNQQNILKDIEPRSRRRKKNEQLKTPICNISVRLKQKVQRCILRR